MGEIEDYKKTLAFSKYDQWEYEPAFKDCLNRFRDPLFSTRMPQVSAFLRKILKFQEFPNKKSDTVVGYIANEYISETNLYQHHWLAVAKTIVFNEMLLIRVGSDMDFYFCKDKNINLIEKVCVDIHYKSIFLIRTVWYTPDEFHVIEQNDNFFNDVRKLVCKNIKGGESQKK